MKYLVLIIFFAEFLFSSYANFAQAADTLGIVINEIAWMGTATSYNDEWIELRNSGGQEISIDGWILKASDGAPEIKITGLIPINRFYLLERTNDDTVPEITADQIYTGALSNSGERLELYDNLGNLIDSVDASSGWLAGDNETKQTMEKTSSGWQTSQSPGGTPKSTNSVKLSLVEEPSAQEEQQPESSFAKASEDKSQQKIEPIIYPSGVVINEILPSPEGADDLEEWIEIFNQNIFEVNLQGWQITDTIGGVKAHVFPEKSSIDPGEFLVLSRPTTKITLNNRGDGLRVIQPNENIIDEVNYENALRGKSYSRFESGWVWTSVLTPGKTNGEEKITTKPAEDGPPQTLIAAAGESIVLTQDGQAPKFSYVFLAALAISIFSGIIIIVLKKKLKIS